MIKRRPSGAGFWANVGLQVLYVALAVAVELAVIWVLMQWVHAIWLASRGQM